MKKPSTKLSLKKNTVRVLNDSALAEVRGGAAPTQAATVCAARRGVDLTAVAAAAGVPDGEV